MSKIVIRGGYKLKGEIEVEGSKNAILPVQAAAILNGGLNTIINYPKLKDVETMLNILKKIGCSIIKENNSLTIDSSTINSTNIPEDLASELRSSIILMGPVLSRFKKVTISYPGVCDTIWAL
jgi:UDP-N-acetylglucosamine enolpyruvyl transferase